MKLFVRNKAYTGPVRAVVMDWAGTAVDYGCVGPAAVFVDVFKEAGVAVTVAEARQFMGLAKKDHIRSMCQLATVASQWHEGHGRLPSEEDVDALYDRTFVMMVESIANHADPIPGVVEVVGKMRGMGIKIGSSTGYVREMMDVLVPVAQQQDYHPDAIVCSSDVPAGRPFPWMCYLNAVQLETYPMEAMIKIGDTVTDIEEGLNAGMWTVGITRTGNELGLTPAEVEALDPDELKRRLANIEARFRDCGANYVVEQVADILPVIEDVNDRLRQGALPLNG